MNLTALPTLPRHWRQELIASSIAINTLMLAMPIATLQIYDRVLTAPHQGTLVMLVFGVMLAVCMEAALRMARSYVSVQLSQRMEGERMRSLVGKVLHSWVQASTAHPPGEYVQAMAAISHQRDYASQRLVTLMVDIPYLVLFVLLISVIGGMLVTVPLAILGMFGGLVWLWGGKLQRAIRQRNRNDELRYGAMLETLTHVHSIKASGLEPRFNKRFSRLQLQAGMNGEQVSWLNHAIANSGVMFSQIVVVLVVAAGAPMVLRGTLTMGGLIACVLLSGRLMQPLQHALSLWISHQEFEQACRQLVFVDMLEQQPMDMQAGARERYGEVHCQHLSYRYDETAPWVLRDQSWHVPAGACVALTGETGSGRTTLLKLLAGVMPPSEGHVQIDGIDPALLEPKNLMHHVAYLPAQSVLVRGTIMENLTCFSPLQAERAREIAQLLGMDAIISRLPAGYDTILDGGEAESIPPGFRQRITIARALLYKPKLILFDQADRSLDREGYQQLFRLLARLKQKATLILATDDENLIRLCSHQYILADGKLQEQQLRSSSVLAWTPQPRMEQLA